MLSVGIVGLPNVGKSTVFNALCAGGAKVSNYAFCTIEPNHAVVSVPEPRLETVARIFEQEKMVPASIEFVDIAGLVRGANTGEGLGNQFLAAIREVDAILHVVRCFEDTQVAHVEGDLDPARDVVGDETELIMADLAAVERRRESDAHLQRLSASVAGAVVALAGKLEADLAEMDEGERDAFVSELHLSVSGLERVIQACYGTLDLVTFFTGVGAEARAWAVRRGTTMAEAAGRIHTDMEKGFIRAEVMPVADLAEVGSWQEAHRLGRVRTEGRDYVVQEGDVLLVRFNP